MIDGRSAGSPPPGSSHPHTRARHPVQSTPSLEQTRRYPAGAREPPPARQRAVALGCRSTSVSRTSAAANVRRWRATPGQSLVVNTSCWRSHCPNGDTSAGPAEQISSGARGDSSRQSSTRGTGPPGEWSAIDTMPGSTSRQMIHLPSRRPWLLKTERGGFRLPAPTHPATSKPRRCTFRSPAACSESCLPARRSSRSCSSACTGHGDW